MNNEPVAIPGAIMAVVTAGLGLAVLFGAPLNREQVGGCITFAAAAIGLVTMIQRSKVTPNTKVVEAVQGGRVVAGEASEQLPAGTVIRAAGEWPDMDGRTVDLTPPPETGADDVEDTPRRALDD